jgi:hypothetical protein
MAKLPSIPSFSNVETLDALTRYSSIAVGDIQNQVNGNLQFDANIKSSTVDVSFPAANVDVLVSHSLGQTPSGFLVANLSASASIYQGQTPWDGSSIYLRSSSICSAKIIVI